MIISAISGMSGPKMDIKPQSIGSSVVGQIENRKPNIENLISTEEYVRDYFTDIPIMIEIAKCESHFKQFDNGGNIHRGVENHQDVGVMQINEFYHLDKARKASIDSYTLDGNVAFARALYLDEGATPWNSSKACWGKFKDKTLAIEKK